VILLLISSVLEKMLDLKIFFVSICIIRILCWINVIIYNDNDLYIL
jgi:hypothetical protein